jgi:hypothetical protein
MNGRKQVPVKSRSSGNTITQSILSFLSGRIVHHNFKPFTVSVRFSHETWEKLFLSVLTSIKLMVM